MNAMVPSVASAPQPGSASLRLALAAPIRKALRRIPLLCDEGGQASTACPTYGSVKRIEPKTM
jgi:hypothetical protein